MKTALTVIISSLLLPIDMAPLHAQGDVPPEAQLWLERSIGTWESTWDRIAPDGSVAQTVHGTEIFEWIIPGRVVLLTTEVPEDNSLSKALMFYETSEKRLYLISVSAVGDLWTLSGEVDEHYTLTSNPKKQPNGRMMTIRFTHSEIDEDSLRAVMESTIDGGQTWRVRTKQVLRRVRG